MIDNDSMQCLQHVRVRAQQLIARVGADTTSAAPLLEAVTALEQHMHDEPSRVAPLSRTPCVPRSSNTESVQTAGYGEEHGDTVSQAHPDVMQFQQFFTEVPTGIGVLEGPEYRYTFTNPAYDQFVGRTQSTGKLLSEVFPELQGQGIYELLDHVYATGEPFVTPEILVRLDRSGDGVAEDIYYDLAYRPLWDKDKQVSGVITYVTDISHRRALEAERERVLQLTQHAQQTADAERQRLLDALRQAPAAICTFAGPEHIFTFTNAMYEHFFGRHDIIGKPFRAVFPEMGEKNVCERLDTVYTTGIPFTAHEVPVQFRRFGSAEMQQVFITISYAPLRDANDAIIGIFMHSVDVTELVEARQRAEAAVVVRDQFLSVAAHELKTPLTSLIGYMQVLHYSIQRRNDNDERTKHTIAVTIAQGQRLSSLIDTLLDVSRISMGHLSLDQAPMDIRALTARVVHELRITVPHRVMTVAVPVESCMVLGDSQRLEQVVVNLVQNAIKYSPGGGDIAVSVGCDATHAWIRVRDEGIGIPQAAVPHLFERFYRVAEGAARGISGMGIGLSLVEEIVTLHGGHVTVESTEGMGSTFTAWLPIAEHVKPAGRYAYSLDRR